MRIACLVLAAINLLFLGWARWVDSPEEGHSPDALARLPRLQLVSDTRPETREEGSARKMAMRRPAVCTSVGPFSDDAGAGRLVEALSHRGYTAVQRTENGASVDGYWVYVSGMKSAADVAEVVDKLEKGGFPDARAMKDASGARRVSVGLFSKRERAERRAWAVQHSAGLQPEIVERTLPATVYWVDVDARIGVPDLAAGLTANDDLLKVGMRQCPRGLGAGELREAEAAPATGVAERPSRVALRDTAGEIARPPRRTTMASAPQVP